LRVVSQEHRHGRGIARFDAEVLANSPLMSTSRSRFRSNQARLICVKLAVAAPPQTGNHSR
jgi:hypothetical protein